MSRHLPKRSGGGVWGRLGCACGLLLCFLTAGCDSREELTRVDTDKEATRILVELSRSGIAQADKVEKKEQRKTAWGITVPKAELSRAREVLLHADLPRESHGGYRGMIEQGGLIPTKTEERAKLMYAMAEELAQDVRDVRPGRQRAGAHRAAGEGPADAGRRPRGRRRRRWC